MPCTARVHGQGLRMVPPSTLRKAQHAIHQGSAARAPLLPRRQLPVKPWSQQQHAGLSSLACPPGRRAVAAHVAAPEAAQSDAAAGATAALSERARLRMENKQKVLAAGFLALTISNMDKVNMSVAIIPMAQEFGWGHEAAGIIQSTFYAGFVVLQLPVGFMASTIGGRRVLPIGLSTWSLATALVPVMASSLPTLAFCRAVVGAGESTGPSCVMDMVARTASKSERARSVSLAYSGLHAGSIVGLLAAPALINLIGWRAMFVVFGAAGLAWYVAFEAFIADLGQRDPRFKAKLTAPPVERLDSMSFSTMASWDGLDIAVQPDPASGDLAVDSDGESEAPTLPFRAFVRERRVQALCFVHFVNNWFYFTMLTWLPSYIVDELHCSDLTMASTLSLLPPLAGIACSNLAGQTADRLMASGWPVRRVRVAMQAIATLGPTACLAAVCLDGGGHEVVLLTASLGVSSFSLAGLYCTHSDMSPKYAGALLGLTNTAGSLAATIGTFLVGYLLERTGSWNLALLAPNMALLCASAACYTLLCANDPVDFDAADSRPFGFERALEGPGAAAAAGIAAVKAAAQGMVNAFRSRPSHGSSAGDAGSSGSVGSGASAPAHAVAEQAEGHSHGQTPIRSHHACPHASRPAHRHYAHHNPDGGVKAASSSSVQAAAVAMAAVVAAEDVAVLPPLLPGSSLAESSVESEIEGFTHFLSASGQHQQEDALRDLPPPPEVSNILTMKDLTAGATPGSGTLRSSRASSAMSGASAGSVSRASPGGGSGVVAGAVSGAAAGSEATAEKQEGLKR